MEYQTKANKYFETRENATRSGGNAAENPLARTIQRRSYAKRRVLIPRVSCVLGHTPSAITPPINIPVIG